MLPPFSGGNYDWLLIIRGFSFRCNFIVFNSQNFKSIFYCAIYFAKCNLMVWLLRNISKGLLKARWESVLWACGRLHPGTPGQVALEGKWVFPSASHWGEVLLVKCPFNIVQPPWSLRAGSTLAQSENAHLGCNHWELVLIEQAYLGGGEAWMTCWFVMFNY